MLTFLNQKFKFLLIVILGIIGVSFIFFGNWTPRGQIRSGNLAVINGHGIKASEFEAAQRATRILYILGTGRELPNSPQVDRLIASETVKRLVILDAAHKAGLTLSPEEVPEYITKHPLFQEKGKYSPARFDTFSKTVLQPQGINTARLQDIITESLLVGHMIDAVGATTVALPAETDEAVDRIYGKSSLQAVLISESSIRQSLKPSDEELKTFYEGNPTQYSDPEKRTVEYVKLSLDAKDAALKDEARQQAMRKLFDKAYEFTNTFFQAYETRQAIPDFKQTAVKAGLEVKSAPVLVRADSIIDPAKGKELAALAFSLNPDRPVSDYQEVSDGFVVLHLINIQPSQPKPFAEVRSQVEKEYLDYATRSRLQEQAQSIAQVLRQNLAAGKSWEQSVAESGLKSASQSPVVPADYKDLKSPAEQALYYWAQELSVGGVSDPTPVSGGAAVYYLAAREKPADAKRSELRPKVAQQLEAARRNQVLNDWVLSLLRQEKTIIPDNILGQNSPNS